MLNKVPTKTGYVPNEYTGRSKMMYGGMDKKKARASMAGGSRMMYGHGGKAKSDIYAMEDACNKMAGYNKSLPKGR